MSDAKDKSGCHLRDKSFADGFICPKCQAKVMMRSFLVNKHANAIFSPDIEIYQEAERMRGLWKGSFWYD